MTRIYKFKMVLLNFFDPCKSVLSVVRFGVLRKAAQFWQQSRPGRNRHIRDHAFRNMVALAARQLAQESQSEEGPGNY